MARRPQPVPPLDVAEATQQLEDDIVVDDGSEVQMACDKFRLERSASSWSGCAGLDDWKQRYTLGKELGSGQTAIVYEAFATWPVNGPLSTPRTTPRGNNSKSPRGGRRPNSARSNNSTTSPFKRRVALKKFSSTGGTMFKQELRALRAVGVHPHVLRLLESFQGPLEDILILEHCGGGDVYDMYASNHGCCMLEPCVVHLIRQLLLALQHLSERGVEHRDVKPENLLLYSNSRDQDEMAGTAGRMRAPPHLKLADFGWANVPESSEGIPAEAAVSGVGSLWYASPELNPQPEGRAPTAPLGDAPLGACDMWSVGVITYLLLLGHSPFNVALREPDHEAQEAKVIRLASEGTINTDERVWSCLPEESRDFITRLIQVEPSKRMTPLEAWSHPFVSRGAGCAEGGGGGGGYLAKLPALLPVADVVWRRIDQFQRLCWITFAHAVAEPELVELRAFQMFIVQQRMSAHSYLHQLAVEIAAVAQPSWFQRKTVWIDALRLAFCYLDGDSDGVLSAEDLSEHLVSEDSMQVARQWVQKWHEPPAGADGNGTNPSKKGITFSGFTWALCSSHAGKHHVQGLSNGHANAHAGGQAEDANHQALFEGRMQATDELCQRFLDEEFDDFGFGP